MQVLISRTIYVFLAITTAAALLGLVGIACLWFVKQGMNDLPYLGWLFSICIAEIAITFLFTRKGIKYLPEVHIMKSSKETLMFMEKFITEGSNATVLSNRASWLIESESLVNLINEKVKRE